MTDYGYTFLWLIMVVLSVYPGCFVHGLFLEGAGWNREEMCLIKQKPKQLIQNLPILRVIPIEGHKLKLQVSINPVLLVSSPKIIGLHFLFFLFFKTGTLFAEFIMTKYIIYMKLN